MPSQPPMYSAPFDDQEQAASLGIFVALWSQIDFLIVLCVANVLKAPIESTDLLMEGMTTGPRINLFRRLAVEHIADGPDKEMAIEFCKDISALINKRNQLLHGWWGRSGGGKFGPVPLPASSHPRYGQFLVRDVPQLNQAVAAQSQRIAHLFSRLYGVAAPKPGDQNVPGSAP